MIGTWVHTCDKLRHVKVFLSVNPCASTHGSTVLLAGAHSELNSLPLTDVSGFDQVLARATNVFRNELSYGVCWLVREHITLG